MRVRSRTDLEYLMTQRNKKRARLMWAYGASLGRIAKALNVTVLAVAHELTQRDE